MKHSVKYNLFFPYIIFVALVLSFLSYKNSYGSIKPQEILELKRETSYSYPKNIFSQPKPHKYEEQEENQDGDSSGSPPDNESKTESTRRVDVKVTNISARISPQFELTLPSGNLYEHFVDEFNNLKFAFNLNYNFLNSSINGDIIFKYPFNKFNPALKLFMELDFEKIFYPQFVNNKLTIVPSEKYISRSRGIEILFSYHLFDDISIIPAIKINEIFKGNLTDQIVVDEGIDITLSTGFVLDLMRAKQPEEKLFFEGLFYRSQFDFRSRDRLNNYISFENSNNFLLRNNFTESFGLIQKVNLNFPIKIWTESLSSFYSLGGFNTIRGYAEDSILCFRFLLVSSTLEKEFFTEKEISFNLKNTENTIHQYRFFILIDSLFSQSSLPVDSPVDVYLSIGGGFSFVLSGLGKRHIRIDTYISQPLKKNNKPILYFKASQYNLEKKL